MLISNFTTVLNPPTFCSASKASRGELRIWNTKPAYVRCVVHRLQDKAWLWSITEKLLCAHVIKAYT